MSIRETLWTEFLCGKPQLQVTEPWRELEQRFKPLQPISSELESVYVSGAVTSHGTFEENQRLFRDATYYLEGLGFDVFNPMTIPLPNSQPQSPERLWQWYMHHCVAAIPLCDCMFMLPGWQNSKGARVEHRIAKLLGLTIIYAPTYE